MARRIFPPEIKEKLIKEQDGICVLCRQSLDIGSPPVLGHKIALANGGADHPDNLFVIHSDCNSRQGTKAESWYSNLTFEEDPFCMNFLKLATKSAEKQGRLMGWLKPNQTLDFKKALNAWQQLLQDDHPMIDTPWKAEAMKRVFSLCNPVYQEGNVGPSNFRHFLIEPTWFWTENMCLELDELIGKSLGNLSSTKLAPKPGIGVGVHFFNVIKSGDGHTKPIPYQCAIHIRRDGSATLYSPLSVWAQINPGPYEENIELFKKKNKFFIHVDDGQWVTNTASIMSTLLEQNIAVFHTAERMPLESVDSKSRKKIAKQMRNNILKVNMVHWRKESDQDKEYRKSHRHIGLDKHWVVRGHIRLQWYPSIGMHKAIYIMPHYKGNLNAPRDSGGATVNVVSR